MPSLADGRRGRGARRRGRSRPAGHRCSRVRPGRLLGPGRRRRRQRDDVRDGLGALRRAAGGAGAGWSRRAGLASGGASSCRWVLASAGLRGDDRDDRLGARRGLGPVHDRGVLRGARPRRGAATPPVDSAAAVGRAPVARDGRLADLDGARGDDRGGRDAGGGLGGDRADAGGDGAAGRGAAGRRTRAGAAGGGGAAAARGRAEVGEHELLEEQQRADREDRGQRLVGARAAWS